MLPAIVTFKLSCIHVPTQVPMQHGRAVPGHNGLLTEAWLMVVGAMAWQPLLLKQLAEDFPDFKYMGVDVVPSVIKASPLSCIAVALLPKCFAVDSL